MDDFESTFADLLYSSVSKLFLLLIIPIFLKYYDRYSLLKEREKLWKEVIKKNESVKKCFDELKSLESNNAYFVYLYVGLVIGAFIIPLHFIYSLEFTDYLLDLYSKNIISIQLSNYLFEKIYSIDVNVLFTTLAKLFKIKNSDDLFTFIYTSSLFVISIIFCLSINLLIPKNSHKLDSYHRYEYIKQKLFSTYTSSKNWYYFLGGYCSVELCFLLLFLISFAKNSSINKYEFGMVLILSTMIFLLFAILKSIINLKIFTEDIKKIINSRFSENFPFLSITTNSGNPVYGKLENVFNTDCIILNNDNKTEAVLCSTIETLNLQGERKTP